MEEQQRRLDALLEEAEARLAGVTDTAALEAFRVAVLGKKGSLTQFLRSMGALSPQDRPVLGKRINDIRARLEDGIARKDEALSAEERDRRLREETVDITLPGTPPPRGGLHPLTRVRYEIEDLFLGMGFTIAEGPEVEYDRYNFELLNIPPNHPARDMQDSFYITDNILLRTHTSPVQARVMERHALPIRIICPGRVYRCDEVDATHSPVFHQIEGLVVDKGVHLGHLKGILDTFAREFYGEGTRTRFRPSFFPFTEPSAEVDVSCYLCGGGDPGCRVCHGSGWVEILGCGMVDPRVLRLCGIDDKVYSGFAFGMGVDRITLSKYGITDMRMLFENDLRFLAQLPGGRELPC